MGDQVNNCENNSNFDENVQKKVNSFSIDSLLSDSSAKSAPQTVNPEQSYYNNETNVVQRHFEIPFDRELIHNRRLVEDECRPDAEVGSSDEIYQKVYSDGKKFFNLSTN